MKRIFTIFALILTVSFVSPHAEAKKFGGGKSFGKSFKTAPVKKQQPQQTDTLKQQQQPGAKQAGSSKKGLMGGLLGGLLAGGLLAAFFGGAFDGIQFMDILIIGLIAFVIFKLFKAMRGTKSTPMGHREAYAGNSPQQQAQRNQAQFRQQANAETYVSTDSEVPFNLPPGFNMNAFLNGSREHYRIIQGAWNHNELGKIREYVSPALFEDLAAERSKLDGEQHTEVMYVDAELVRADYDANTAQLSIKFSGRYKDQAEGVEEDITDVWHLERDLRTPNAPWLIVGIQA
ncbi:Tim44 domain-containing protein [Photobacterium aphoticum]|uniref:Preprotein translocase subunit Tim44 n=1 Tax=Photobacterium aphoticum TaxID=754436 RepID=A0A0J1GIL6_9GAMM|nr:TIM44-like domain-containing protein [Photobacterium aphoticum]KLU99405.1 preprotein translocase subunit Tim44 [Photobacterium aphoticum]PSU53109.1 preprotein translocase subunit Tim44 [Photobacterium aphoticum]GHA38452.1 preprotein translocase subunit Tim44 [Photobacterium aphoticum]